MLRLRSAEAPRHAWYINEHVGKSYKPKRVISRYRLFLGNPYSPDGETKLLDSNKSPQHILRTYCKEQEQYTSPNVILIYAYTNKMEAVK